jgi:hypothetical protein
MGSLEAAVLAVVVVLVEIVRETGNVAGSLAYVIAFDRAGALTLHVTEAHAATGDGTSRADSDRAMAGIVAVVGAVRATEPRAFRGAPATERATIAAGMTALVGVVAGRDAAIRADSPAGRPNRSAVEPAIARVAAEVALLLPPDAAAGWPRATTRAVIGTATIGRDRDNRHHHQGS